MVNESINKCARSWFALKMSYRAPYFGGATFSWFESTRGPMGELTTNIKGRRSKTSNIWIHIKLRLFVTFLHVTANLVIYTYIHTHIKLYWLKYTLLQHHSSDKCKCTMRVSHKLYFTCDELDLHLQNARNSLVCWAENSDWRDAEMALGDCVACGVRWRCKVVFESIIVCDSL